MVVSPLTELSIAAGSITKLPMFSVQTMSALNQPIHPIITMNTWMPWTVKKKK